MERLDVAELYLTLTRLDGPKRDHNKAIKLLNRYPQVKSHIRDYLEYGISCICNNLEWVDGEPLAKLTPTSVSIGRTVMRSIKCSKEWQDDVNVIIGDFILEGLFHVKLIDLDLPAQRSGKPAYVVPLFDIEDPPITKRVIRGLYSEPPGKLPLIQKVQFKDGMEFQVPLIKKWNEEDQTMFDVIVSHSQAYRSACKLANTGWQVNKEVYEACIRQPHKFYDEKCRSDENKSKIIEYKYTVDIASKVRDETFYFSPEFDYRGRIYFTCPFFNFQGSDLARGMLLFKDKKYVTEAGLKWMKIHAAASYNQSYKIDEIPEWCTSDYKTHLEAEELEDISVDKMTLQDRELWVDNNWQLLQQTVEKKLIHACEKPVSFLAVAIEIMGYHKSNGFYFSALPIPVDGSNNGWQHLGAISKDVNTGRLVGLQPVKIQQDFYVQTAKKLNQMTKDEECREILDTMPMKKIRKGISKRGSMTRAYSAGAQKIAINMYADCKSAGFTSAYGITEDHCKKFARTLVKAIAEVCPGPLLTMKFLQKLAQHELVDKDKIHWVSPSGFPVIYECYHTRLKTVVGIIKGCNDKSRGQIQHKVMIYSTSPDQRGFMCGISPNFIHSQDAAHMAKVICQFDGDFGAVHDSFSTHASQVEELLEITKKEFIDMYDHENYFDDIVKRLSPEAQVEQPPLGELDIKEIEKSDYFFA